MEDNKLTIPSYITENKEFRDGLSELLKNLGYTLLWTSARTAVIDRLFDIPNVYTQGGGDK